LSFSDELLFHCFVNCNQRDKNFFANEELGSSPVTFVQGMQWYGSANTKPSDALGDQFIHEKKYKAISLTVVQGKYKGIHVFVN
jgi:hypothetical protein